MITPNSTPRPQWPAQLMAAGAAGVLVLTLAHPSATRQFTWPWVLVLTGLWLAPIVAALGTLAVRDFTARPNSLLGAGLMLLAAATLLAAMLSPFARLSVLRIWPTLSGVALFFWLYDWLAEPTGATPARNEFLARGLAWFGGGLTVVSVIGWYVKAAGVWATRNDVPFGHSTYTAGALLLVLPWLVRATLQSRGLGRAGWAMTAAAALVALVATSSRGGVLAIAVVGAMVAGLAVMRAAWPRRSKLLLALGAAAVLLLALLANPRLRELARGGGWGESARESNAQRSAMLEAGARLGAMRPLTGWGPGTVPLIYPKVRAQLSGGVDNILQLHNSVAQLWATLGGLGLLALVLLLMASGRQLYRVCRQPTVLSVTSAAGVLGYGLFALTDHQLDLPAMNALLVLNLALFFQESGQPDAASSPAGPRRLALIAGSVMLAPMLALTGKDLVARSFYEQSLTLFEHNREADGLDSLATAADWAPYDPYYRHQLAQRFLDKRLKATDPAALAQLTAAATTQLEHSLAAGCLEEFAHFNLGWLALDAGQPAKAAQYFVATLREAPHRGGAYLGLGLALRAAGDQTGAVRAFALEWIDNPVTFTAPVWEWPDFAPLRPQVAREAESLLAGLATNEPKAAYVHGLWQWWSNGTGLPAHGFNAETETFVRRMMLPRDDFNRAYSSYAWDGLFEAWHRLPDTTAFAALTGDDAPFTAALLHRAARHPDPQLHDFLTAGLENESALLENLRPARAGYGVLALHPDGPVLLDLYLKQDNRLVSTFASTLFPAKGWIPARELLQRLPALPDHP